MTARRTTVEHATAAPNAIHLDTNFIIGLLGAGSAMERALLTWIDAGHRIAVSVPAWAEFLVGPVASATVQAAADIVGEPLPLGHDEAVLAAACYNAAGRRRGSMVDCMIAATAINAGAALATANVADFERLVPLGLRLAG